MKGDAEFVEAGITITIDAENVPRDVEEFHGTLLDLMKHVVGHHATKIATQEVEA